MSGRRGVHHALRKCPPSSSSTSVYTAQGLEILAVSLDALGAQVVAPFMQSRRLSFPTLLDTKNLVQRLYHTTGVPESFIVDKRGMLVEKVVGPRNWASPQTLAQFERLLAMPATD